MPKRLEATYIDLNNEKKTPVMLHRAILGSFERFIGILIEEYEAKFPIWIAPTQIILLSITDRNIEKCIDMNNHIKTKGYRSKIDIRNEKIGYKIRESTMDRIPLIGIIGDNEEKNNTISIRSLKGENLGNYKLEDLYKLMDSLIEEKGRSH